MNYAIPQIILNHFDFDDIAVIEGKPPLDFRFRFPLVQLNDMRVGQIGIRYDYSENQYHLKFYSETGELLTKLDALRPFEADSILAQLTDREVTRGPQIKKGGTVAILSTMRDYGENGNRWGRMEYQTECAIYLEKFIRDGATKIILNLDSSVSFLILRAIALLAERYHTLFVQINIDEKGQEFREKAEKLCASLGCTAQFFEEEKLRLPEPNTFSKTSLRKSEIYAILNANVVLISLCGRRAERLVRSMERMVEETKKQRVLIHKKKMLQWTETSRGAEIRRERMAGLWDVEQVYSQDAAWMRQVRESILLERICEGELVPCQHLIREDDFLRINEFSIFMCPNEYVSKDYRLQKSDRREFEREFYRENIIRIFQGVPDESQFFEQELFRYFDEICRIPVNTYRIVPEIDEFAYTPNEILEMEKNIATVLQAILSGKLHASDSVKGWISLMTDSSLPIPRYAVPLVTAGELSTDDIRSNAFKMRC